MESKMWVDVYSPKTLQEYICNKSVRAKLNKFIEAKDIPHLILYGDAGIGKSSCAKMLCKELDVKSLYIDASTDTSIDMVRERILPFTSISSFGKLKVVILNECDRLSKQAFDALKQIVEDSQDICRFVFITNRVDEIPSPIISRCEKLTFNNSPKKQIYALCEKILLNEDIEFEQEDVEDLIIANYPDIRATIKLLQGNCEDGKFEYKENDLNEFEEEFINIIKSKDSVKNKYVKVRRLFLDNSFSDWNYIYDLLYKRIDDYTITTNCPDVIVEIADYLHKSRTMPNQELNALACICKILTVADV